MIVNSIILGRAKGSAGNVTTTTVGGRVILKQKATEVRNPRTLLQVKQRSAFSMAVAAWQFVGNFVKSGITSKSLHANQYNTFVSKNIPLLKEKNFDKASFTAADLLNLYATSGNVSGVTVEFSEISADELSVSVAIASDAAGVQAGDKIVLVAAETPSQAFKRAEHILTADEVAKQSFMTFIDVSKIGGNTNDLLAIWYESADGKRSTTARFMMY